MLNIRQSFSQLVKLQGRNPRAFPCLCSAFVDEDRLLQKTCYFSLLGKWCALDWPPALPAPHKALSSNTPLALLLALPDSLSSFPTQSVPQADSAALTGKGPCLVEGSPNPPLQCDDNPSHHAMWHLVWLLILASPGKGPRSRLLLFLQPSPKADRSPFHSLSQLLQKYGGLTTSRCGKQFLDASR